jgi:deoxyribodipyrimidine photo-lyase
MVVEVQKIRIVLFQRDLRLDDNTMVLAAAEHALEGDDIILPLFIFDPHQIDETKNKWRSAACQTFMIESLLDLQLNLEENSAALMTIYGDPAAVLSSIISSTEISAVYLHIDFTPFSKERRSKIEKVCKKFGVEYFEYQDYLLLDELINTGKQTAEDDTSRAELTALPGNKHPYKIFGAFYKAIKLKKVRNIDKKQQQILLKKTPWMSPAAAKKFIKSFIGTAGRMCKITEFMPEKMINSDKEISKGGRYNALKLLKKILDNKENSIEKYAIKRDELSYNDTLEDVLFNKKSGENYNFITSHLSAYIKFGCVSIREVYHFFKENIKNSKSRKSLLRQLYWRDFFYNLIWSDPYALDSSYNQVFEKIAWISDPAEVKRRLLIWKEGRTGFPIVDAAMHEIKNSNFMHNRGRLIAASFLTKDLLIYWRHGEKYFSKQLIDYDPAINNLNWQTVLGCGPFALKWFRIMNPWRQSEKYDPEAKYIKKWLPQLKDIPADHLHNWYEYWQNYDLKKIKYYKPILDHKRQKDVIISKFKKVIKRAADV